MSAESSTPVLALPTAPAGMVEWSRTAATLLRAVARAYVHGAPTEVQAHADDLWKLASRAATLTGVLETQSKAFEQLVESGAHLRAAVEQKVEALAGKDSAESRKRIAELRSDLDRLDAALEADLRAGRQNIEARVREALECEKAFTETARVLVERLRPNDKCRDLLDEIAKRPDDDDAESPARGTTIARASARAR